MKNIQKSVRISTDVYEYISAFDGKNFNDKFESCVRYCMENVSYIRRQRSRLEMQCLELSEKIEEYRKILSSLERIQTYVNFACDHVIQK